MLMYNPEDKTYSKFITIEEMAEVQEKIKQIEERLKNTPVNPPYNFESEGNIDINSVSELKKLIRTDNFNLNSSINRRRASLFLVACYFCMEKEPLDFLIAEGSEVNRTDIFGYNAIMSVILNENMEEIVVEGEELLARAIQHEVDHLDGTLYVSKVEGELLNVTEEQE